MNNPKVYAIETPKTLRDGRRVVYGIIRWADSTGKMREESVGRMKHKGGTVTRAALEDARRAKELGIATGDARRDRVDAVTLEQLRASYADRRRQTVSGRGHRRGASKLSDDTIELHTMAIRYLIQHFGASARLDAITDGGAQDFIDALENGKLVAARTTKVKRTWGMSQQTVKRYIRDIKAIMAWAKLAGMIHANPFADFDGAPLASDANHYVPLTDFERLVKAAPSGWAAFYGLQRLAGLRRGEALAMPWSGYAVDKNGKRHWVGVDLQRRRLCLVAEKTDAYRVVPIAPRLAQLLQAVVDESDAAGVFTLTVCGLSENNLTRQAQLHVQAAGLTAWAKLYQAMRSSAENDWKVAGVAEPTYTAWLGHSANVSRRHYVSPTEAEFDAITKPQTTLRMAG